MVVSDLDPNNFLHRNSPWPKSSRSDKIRIYNIGFDKFFFQIRRIQAVGGLCLLVFFYSLLLSIFRSKAGGYPYSFLFK
jgi:hypothetical protein